MFLLLEEAIITLFSACRSSIIQVSVPSPLFIGKKSWLALDHAFLAGKSFCITINLSALLCLFQYCFLRWDVTTESHFILFLLYLRYFLYLFICRSQASLVLCFCRSWFDIFHKCNPRRELKGAVWYEMFLPDRGKRKKVWFDAWKEKCNAYSCTRLQRRGK